MRYGRMTGWMLALAVAAGTGGCVAAAAAGAGAGAAYYLTARGAEGLAPGNLDQVTSRARSVMSEMGITETNSEDMQSATERTLHGKANDLDVTITLKAKSKSQSNVEVTAQKNAADWDKDYAQQVVAKIVRK